MSSANNNNNNINQHHSISSIELHPEPTPNRNTTSSTMNNTNTTMVTPKRSNSNGKMMVESVPYGSLDDTIIPPFDHRNNNNNNDHTTANTTTANMNSTGGGLLDGDINSCNSYGTVSNSTDDGREIVLKFRLPSIRKLAMILSLYLNVAITISKLIAYIQTFSLSVLAALLDSVLDVVSQIVLNYTEKHSTMQRSSAFYPAGAARLEPIGVLTCAALMGMASFEVLKESLYTLIDKSHHDLKPDMSSFYNMLAIVLIKLGLLYLCNRGANKRKVILNKSKSNISNKENEKEITNSEHTDTDNNNNKKIISNNNIIDGTTIINEEPDDTKSQLNEKQRLLHPETSSHDNNNGVAKHVVQLADPTLEALAQDHWNDALSNGVAAIALLFAVREPSLWFLDPVGAIIISLYIIYSWYMTGKEQIEHLTGRSAPDDFIEDIIDLANVFDDRFTVDTVRAYHFGPKFLVEIEIVMDANTLLYESHDLGMDLQYEIEGREEVERCFVHIDYQARPYDEHVVSKVPELRERLMTQNSNHKLMRSAQSV